MAAVRRFQAACKSGPATCITAWDYPSARLAIAAGVDLILVGDSIAVTTLGHPNRTTITLDEIIYHCRAVSRAITHPPPSSQSPAATRPFLLGDLPLGSYEITPEQAVASALRLIKEGHVDGVKLEGGKEMAPQVAAITKVGIPVVGHIGLTPQRSLSNFYNNHNHILNKDGTPVVAVDVSSATGAKDDPKLSFGSTVESAEMILDDALGLQKAGCVAVVMEAVAASAARLITDILRVPTIGIGSGSGTSSQMVLQNEVLGYEDTRLGKWHGEPFVEVGRLSLEALKKWKEGVGGRAWPGKEQEYTMKDEAEERVLGDLRKRAREMQVYENVIGRERRGSKNSY